MQLTPSQLVTKQIRVTQISMGFPETQHLIRLYLFVMIAIRHAAGKEYDRQIDQMVYELYGLSKEEIKIVEDYGCSKL